MTVIERDVAKSVLQNIRVILTTPKGSDVHRPEFGSELYRFIDQPLTALTVSPSHTVGLEHIAGIVYDFERELVTIPHGGLGTPSRCD